MRTLRYALPLALISGTAFAVPAPVQPQSPITQPQQQRLAAVTVANGGFDFSGQTFANGAFGLNLPDGVPINLQSGSTREFFHSTYSAATVFQSGTYQPLFLYDNGTVGLGATTVPSLTDTGALTSSGAASFTGSITVPTITAGDSSTKAASTAFVGAAVSSATAPILYNGQQGSQCDSTARAFCRFKLYRTTNSTTANQQLTADGTGTETTTNSACVPIGTTAIVMLEFIGYDSVTGGNASFIINSNYLLTRANTAGSSAVMTYKNGASNGTPTPVIGGDANGCITVTITPANADTTYWTVHLNTYFAQ